MATVLLTVRATITPEAEEAFNHCTTPNIATTC